MRTAAKEKRSDGRKSGLGLFGAQRRDLLAPQREARGEPGPEEGAEREGSEERQHFLQREAAGAIAQAGPDGDQGARRAIPEAADDEPPMLGKHEPPKLPRAKADGAEEAEFTPALEDVARDHDREADAAEEQAESAEH